MYQNDRVAKLAALTAAAARWTMADVNAIIASSLAGVLMPVEADRGANAGSRNCNLWELCATVCPCPGWKFAQAYSFPVDPESRASSGFAPRTPSSLPFADKLLATVPKFRTDKSPARTIAAQLVYVSLPPPVLFFFFILRWGLLLLLLLLLLIIPPCGR